MTADQSAWRSQRRDWRGISADQSTAVYGPFYNPLPTARHSQSPPWGHEVDWSPLLDEEQSSPTTAHGTYGSASFAHNSPHSLGPNRVRQRRLTPAAVCLLPPTADVTEFPEPYRIV